MKDQFNREINYLRISITDKCNYNCRYCKPDDSPETLSGKYLTDEELIQIVRAAAKMGVTKIRLTGGEPLMRKGLVNLIKQMKEIDGINEIAMTTNGSILYHQLEELKAAGLDRVNLSLDSLDPTRFKYITNGGELSDVFKSIKKLLELEMKPVKLNVVLMKGFNDDEIQHFVNLTKDQEITVRFIELMPIGSHDFSFKKHYLSSDEIINRYPELEALPQRQGETARYFKLPNSKGKVGLISAVSHHFCDSCNRLRITSDGKVKPCLHLKKEYDLLEYIRNHHNEEQTIEEFLKNCILKKPKSHKINDEDFEKVDRSMYRIGG